MSDRSFFDTNIFVYSFSVTEPAKAKIARSLITKHLEARTGVVSFQVVQEFLNVLYKRLPSAMSFDERTAYITTVFRPMLAVHSSLNLYIEGLSICQKRSVSWYDSLIIAAAAEAKCSILYSEDLQDGATINGVTIRNPFRAAIA